MRNVLSLISANVFHVKAENERLTAAGSRCRQNLKLELFTFRKIALKCVPHVQHDYFSSFTQSYHWFVALLLMLPSSFLSTLPFAKVAVIWVYWLVGIFLATFKNLNCLQSWPWWNSAYICIHNIDSIKKSPIDRIIKMVMTTCWQYLRISWRIEPHECKHYLNFLDVIELPKNIPLNRI